VPAAIPALHSCTTAPSRANRSRQPLAPSCNKRLRVIGGHGIHKTVTVGQRKGLGFPWIASVRIQIQRSDQRSSSVATTPLHTARCARAE